MLLTRFDDSSLDATRRSIILYTALAIALYYYRPSVDLSALFDTKIAFAKESFAPSVYGFALLLSLLYLYFRLLVWLPLHESTRAKNFAELRESFRQETQKVITATAAAEEKYNQTTSKLRELEQANLGQTLENIEDAIQRYIAEAKRLQTQREDIRSDFLKMLAKFEGQVSEYPVNAPRRKLTKEEMDSLFQKVQTEFSKTSAALTGTISHPPAGNTEFNLPDFSTLFATAKTEKEILELLEGASKNLRNATVNFSFEDVNVLGISNLEIAIFAKWLPLSVISFGISAAIGLILKFEGWFDFIVLTFPLVFLAASIGFFAFRSRAKQR
ncbi:hypothetical protein PsAD13_02681 [Pseudovibrio sp. Ad13]|uniref:hypothetical protein n=1 Tax=Pseudovibrio sp. Ad13 TaxID=989396 RepID=UPI0007AE7FE9|nr:hypothetical protein [Pseudovibrio sp. Ad13]KZK83630.1 hypothetical protein PsAD13_02681 [Pseudovibrio sp. Ad13]